MVVFSAGVTAPVVGFIVTGNAVGTITSNTVASAEICTGMVFSDFPLFRPVAAPPAAKEVAVMAIAIKALIAAEAIFLFNIVYSLLIMPGQHPMPT